MLKSFNKGPIVKLPIAPSFTAALNTKLLSKPILFVDNQPPSQAVNNERKMALQGVDYIRKIDEVEWDNDLLSMIADMNPEQLVRQLDTMQISQQDKDAFSALKTNIQKKSTYINVKTIDLIREQGNQNTQLASLLRLNKNILPFAFENFALLDAKSRQLVKSEVQKVLDTSDQTCLTNLLPTVEHLNAFVKLADNFNYTGKKVLSQFVNGNLLQLPNILGIQSSEPLLKQLIDLSSVVETIDRLTEGKYRSAIISRVQDQINSPSDQVLENFHKTEFTPVKLKELSIGQLTNLLYLCKQKEQMEPLLGIISQSKLLSNLSNQQLISLTEKVIDTDKKSILSPFMQNLEQVPGVRFDMEETAAMLSQLARLTNRVDLQLLDNFLDCKVKQIYLPPSSKDFSKSLDLLTGVYKHHPFMFKRMRFQVRMMITAVQEILKKEVIPLSEMIRFASLLNPSLAKPVFLLKEIIESKESLCTDVPEKEVELLVDCILKRVKQLQISFDHLKHSFSVIHSEFVPYQVETFQFLQRVVNDQVSCKLTNKIAANSFVVSRLFLDNQEAEKSCKQHMQRQIKELQDMGLNAQIEDFTNIFHMIANFRQITPSPEIKALSHQLYEAALLKLKDKSESSVDGIQTFQQLLQVNFAVLHALRSFENFEELLQKYRDQCWFSPLIEQCLYQKMQMPQSHHARSMKATPEIEQKMMQSAKNISWSELERQSQHLLKHFLLLLESTSLSDPQVRELAKKYLLKMQSSRSLHGEELSNLYLLISKLQPDLKETRDFDQLMLKVASNLRTIGAKLMYTKPEQEETDDQNLFKSLNANILEEERAIKQLILSQYMQIFQSNPQIFQENKYSLAPLSNLMAQLFDSFEHQDVLNCMNLLSATNIDNYSEEFILKLYENFAQQAFMAQMYDQNPKFFFEFSKAWPRFLRNNAILTQLTRYKGQSVLVSDQSETLQILTRRNVLHPELMNLHLDTFIRMKDKEQVSKYLRQFLESAAFFGYTNDVNVEQLTQVFRRIYRTPSECDIEELLNFLVVLAISKSYYQDFDEKSKVFIDQALDYIENSTISQQYGSQQSSKPGEKYCGTHHLIATRPKDLQEQGVQKQSENLESEQEFKLSFFQQIPTFTKTYNKQAVVNISKKLSEESDRVRTAHFQVDSDQEEEDENLPNDILEEKSVNIDEDEPEVDIVDERVASQQKSTRKSYERKGSESQYQEDFEYLKFRNKKLAQMNKKDKHLLMYSNINQLNFVDINQKSIAKAWTILFHFRAKSLQSMLFEEFNSITQRNAVGKTKSHDLFSKLYLKIMEQSYENGFMIQMANSCDRTGWPIDIGLRFKDSKSGQTQQHAIYFLLQEELCYNAQTQSEEPLGLQKLMVRHLQTISDYKVHFVTENEAQANLEGVVDRLMEKMNE